MDNLKREIQNVPPQTVLTQIAFGAMMTQALGIAAKLGIADILNDGGKSTEELAAATSTHAPSLYRVLRSLAGAGVFAETSPRLFENTELSGLLRSDMPGSMRSGVIFMAEPWHYNVWGNMLHSVQTGGTAWKETHGEDVFGWFAHNPAEAEIFHRAMTDMTAASAPAIVEAYDFSGFAVLADIAGGHGYLLAQILKLNPKLHGILFDVPPVIAGSDALLQREGVHGRVERSSGDFFIQVPTADAYIIKHIIHDWDDDRSVLIMKNIREAMKGDGKLLIVESVVPEGNDPHYSKLLDLEMLTSPGGMERTEAEYRGLLARAGFEMARIVPTRSPFSIIEAVRR